MKKEKENNDASKRGKGYDLIEKWLEEESVSSTFPTYADNDVLMRYKVKSQIIHIPLYSDIASEVELMCEKISTEKNSKLLKPETIQYCITRNIKNILVPNWNERRFNKLLSLYINEGFLFNKKDYKLYSSMHSHRVTAKGKNKCPYIVVTIIVDIKEGFEPYTQIDHIKKKLSNIRKYVTQTLND